MLQKRKKRRKEIQSKGAKQGSFKINLFCHKRKKKRKDI